jgi:hypothetical protein
MEHERGAFKVNPQASLNCIPELLDAGKIQLYSRTSFCILFMQSAQFKLNSSARFLGGCFLTELRTYEIIVLVQVVT